MKKRWLILICGVIVAALASGIYYYRHRHVRSEEDFVAILPGGEVTTFYANVEALRSSGTLKLLTGSRVVHEREYEKFVHEINFDYARDLDRLAGVVDGKRLYFLLRGRFDWEKLRLYPSAHGGACIQHVCRVPTSTPGRWASYHLIQPNVLALAFAEDQVAVNRLQPPPPDQPRVNLPGEPVWVKLSDQVLKNPGELPLALRMFAISLQPASPVVLSAGTAAEGSGSAFTLQLNAGCPSESTAETVRNQLEIQTKMLQLELKREGQKPGAGDLTGLLTAGSFQIVDKHVIGSWPVRFELLKSLQ